LWTAANAQLRHLQCNVCTLSQHLQCKLSDFGLANDVYRYGMIKGATERRVPFKWVSPERMMEGKVPITWRSDV